jgi:tRNA1(Val) A37 N6-methylase TrmN6
MLEPGAAIAEDAFLGGRIRLRQPRRGHRAGTDAVLLAALAAPREGETVYDLGAGVGAVGLIVAARTKARVVFVEREPVLAALCRENIALNRLEARARVIEADLLAPAAASPTRPSWRRGAAAARRMRCAPRRTSFPPTASSAGSRPPPISCGRRGAWR